MNYSKTSATLKTNAKKYMSGKYYTTFMVLLFYVMLTIFWSGFSASLSERILLTTRRFVSLDTTASAFLYSGVIWLLSLIFNIFDIGFCLYFLNIACGNMFHIFNLFYGFSHQFGKCLLLSGINFLLTAVCTIPLKILHVQYIATNTIHLPTLCSLLCIQLVLFVFYVPISLALSQLYFVMLDYPDLSVADTLKQSIRIMKGHYLQLCYIQASFLPLYLLAFLSLNIGLIWIVPYTRMTYALFYLDLMKPAKDSRPVSHASIDLSTPEEI